MGGCRPTPTGFVFVEPSGNVVTITDSFPLDSESGVGIFDVPAGIDLGSYTEGTVGVQVEDDGTWYDSTLVALDPENPTQFYCVMDTLTDLAGKNWRLISPVTTWTAGGNPLYPTFGTFGPVPAGMMAAKIAAAKTLTGRTDLIK